MKPLFALLALAFAALAGPAAATNCPSFPYVLTNGQTADANQVMADFNTLLNCSNVYLAHSGVNTDIIQLAGLTTPITVAQGGTGNTTGAPSGTAGGQLTGTYPNPNLAAGAAMANLGYHPANVAGDTFTGPVAFNQSITLNNTVASGLRDVVWDTVGLNRWVAAANQVAETGSNVGSNWDLDRYSDAGSFIDTPLECVRSTGVCVFPDGLVANVTGNLSGNATTATSATTAGSATTATSATTAAALSPGATIAAAGTGISCPAQTFTGASNISLACTLSAISFNNASKGHYTFAGGLILNWWLFSVTGSGGTQVTTYDQAFTTAALSVICTPNGSAQQQIGVSGVGTSQATVETGAGDGSSRTGYCAAIGY